MCFQCGVSGDVLDRKNSALWEKMQWVHTCVCCVCEACTLTLSVHGVVESSSNECAPAEWQLHAQ